jgi:DNA-directed RNA polymerase subunit RPC12/RpoP
VEPIFYALDAKFHHQDIVYVHPIKEFTVKNPDAVCPECGYNFTSYSTINSLSQETADATCPKCHHKYYYIITKELRRKIGKIEPEKVDVSDLFRNKKIDTSGPVLYGIISGFVALFYFFLFLHEPILRELTGLVTLSLFTGSILISQRNFKTGSILCYIGGIFTLPIGILGFIAGNTAWKYSKW